MELGVLLMMGSGVLALHNSGLRADVLGVELWAFELLGVLGGVLAGVGVLSLSVAIPLYVDADSRRDAVALTVRMSGSGVALALRASL